MKVYKKNKKNTPTATDQSFCECICTKEIPFMKYCIMIRNFFQRKIKERGLNHGR
nr:MAG TPA: hypothetical protein [Caudoviricetes sp.]